MHLVQLQLGDCMEVLQQLPAGSIGSLVSDPPYGLEFMGKEWDKLEPARSKQRWKDGDRKLIGNGRCLVCGKYRFSGTPCTCKNPEWENRTLEHIRAMQAWHERWLQEVHRILRSGGMAKVFSGSRTFHRLAAAMESVGFDILRVEAWGYGQGFPKSHDVSKALDRHLVGGRECTRVAGVVARNPKVIQGGRDIDGGDRPFMRKARELGYHTIESDVPATPEAMVWDGYGTALKPAWEPFVVGRKP